MIPALAITVVLGMIPFFGSCSKLYDDVLRVHIKANSDTAADQSLKLAIRDRVVGECSSYYDGCDGKEDALRITQERLGEIEAIARDEIREHGFDYAVSAEIGEAYFHTRAYDDFTMPAGWYDALRVTIGEGKGENWWCVMYPALCVGAACRDEMREKLDEGEYRVVTTDRVDFRFKAVEYWESFLNWFR